MGWRIPFLLAIPLIAVSLHLRWSIDETSVFKMLQARGERECNPCGPRSARSLQPSAAPSSRRCSASAPALVGAVIADRMRRVGDEDADAAQAAVQEEIPAPPERRRSDPGRARERGHGSAGG